MLHMISYSKCFIFKILKNTIVANVSYYNIVYVAISKCPDHNAMLSNGCIIYKSLNGFPYMRYAQRFGYNTQNIIKIMSIYAHMSVLHVTTLYVWLNLAQTIATK